MGKLVGLLVVCWWVWIAAVAVVRQPDKTRQLNAVAGIVTGSLRPDVPTPALAAYNRIAVAVIPPPPRAVVASGRAADTVAALPVVAAKPAPRRAETVAIARPVRPPVKIPAPVRAAQRSQPAVVRVAQQWRPTAPPQRQASRPSPPPVLRTVGIRQGQGQFWARLQSSSF